MSDLLPKQTCIGAGCMSAKCHKRTSQGRMSSEGLRQALI
jgi:hypothetical protein